jgi:hypothetical protein
MLSPLVPSTEVFGHSKGVYQLINVTNTWPLQDLASTIDSLALLYFVRLEADLLSHLFD